MMTTNTARADSSSPNSAQSSDLKESNSIANPSDEVVVYLVDDQQIELDLMRRWCEKGGYVTETFDRPEVFLKCVRRDVIGCVVADLRMPVISGLDLQKRLVADGLALPVILVTGHGDADNCRTAFQQGVFDFIEKGFDADHFLSVIGKAIHQCRRDQFEHEVKTSARQLIDTISPRENDVMRLLAGGATLKMIAQQLKISVQTASKHRTSIFTKLGIDNEVDLYKTLRVADYDLNAHDVDPQDANGPAVDAANVDARLNVANE